MSGEFMRLVGSAVTLEEQGEVQVRRRRMCAPLTLLIAEGLCELFGVCRADCQATERALDW